MTRGREEIQLHIMYYMFTTLTTVGFGDFHPKTDAERVWCILVFLIGVSFFQMTMGNFLEILDVYREYNSPVDESD